MLENSWFSWKARWQGRALRMLRTADDAIEAARRHLAPAPVTIFRDVTAPWLATAVGVAARLRLADHLGEEHLTVADLAARTGINPEQLGRLLGTLQAHGYFRLSADGRVRSTRLSRALDQNVAGAFAELQGSGWYRKAFHSGRVLASWQEDRNSFELATGEHFFDYLESHPEAGQLFLAAMDNVTRFCTPFLAAEISLAPGHSVLDVGGGNGELARTLAARYPANQLAVLDRGAGAKAAGSPANYSEFQGDFFTTVPAGYDHLFLKNILHDWDDEKSVSILERCREAVTEGARLTLIECLLPEPGQTAHAQAATFALDWNVWLTLSGRERSASEYGALLERAGWKAGEVRPTATPYSLLEAVAR